MDIDKAIYTNNDPVYIAELNRLDAKIAKRQNAGHDTSDLEKARPLFDKVLNPGPRFDPQRQFVS